MGKIEHISLFTGIGGFDVGFSWSDIETIMTCEINHFNHNFLKKRNPLVRHELDIRKIERLPSATIVSAGFPCQNISLAASKNRTGVDGDKSGLWRELIRLCSPDRHPYIVLENSPTIIKHGFELILEEFAKIGYDAEWQTLCGYQFGIPQRRKRLYAILYPISIGNRMAQEEIFAGWDKPIYPTWRDTEPKIYGVDNVVSDRVDKHRGLGNAVQPLVAHYIAECIKLNIDKYCSSLLPPQAATARGAFSN